MRTVFATMLLCLAGATAPLAQQSEADALIEAVEKSLIPGGFGDIQPWLAYPARPAREALDEDLFAEYVGALERKDCETAVRLAQFAYLQQYPALKHAFANRDVVMTWNIDVFRHAYPDAALCAAVADLDRETAKLKAEGHPLPPVRTFLTTRHDDHKLYARDRYARVIESLARDDYVPALQVYLRLEDDDIVKLEAMDRLYLLFRLQVLNEPLADQQARIENASRYVLPEAIRRARCWAEVGNVLPFSLNDECPVR